MIALWSMKFSHRFLTFMNFKFRISGTSKSILKLWELTMDITINIHTHIYIAGKLVNNLLFIYLKLAWFWLDFYLMGLLFSVWTINLSIDSENYCVVLATIHILFMLKSKLYLICFCVHSLVDNICGRSDKNIYVMSTNVANKSAHWFI